MGHTRRLYILTVLKYVCSGVQPKLRNSDSSSSGSRWDPGLQTRLHSGHATFSQRVTGMYCHSLFMYSCIGIIVALKSFFLCVAAHRRDPAADCVTATAAATPLWFRTSSPSAGPADLRTQRADAGPEDHPAGLDPCG